MNPYRIATDKELADANCDECYDLLIGPSGFECLLTEPEDRRWSRDGRKVVAELNRLHAELRVALDRIASINEMAESDP